MLSLRFPAFRCIPLPFACFRSRRLDFARVLTEDGRVLLLDEPTAGLDAANARNILERIAAMEGRMNVVATHDLEGETLRRFGEVLLLEGGKPCFAERRIPSSPTGGFRN